MRNRQRPTRPATIFCCGLLLATMAVSAEHVHAEDLNRIIMQVNDEIITLQDYEDRKATEISTLLADPNLSPDESQERLAEVGKQVMQQMLREMLLMSRARQIGLRIDDTEVDAAQREIQQRQGINNHDQLLQALHAAGMTLEQMRKNLHRELLWSRLVGREVTSKIEISEEELRAYYRNHPEDFSVPEQRQLKEVIVLESSGLEHSELERLANEVYQKLKSGESLETVITPLQDENKSTGAIELGWLRRDELEASLAEAVWQVDAGEITPPIKARGGFHIVQVLGLREASQRPFSEVEPLIQQRERSQRFDKELRSYLAKLEEQSFIREDLPSETLDFRTAVEEFETEDELDLFHQPLPAGKTEVEPAATDTQS